MKFSILTITKNNKKNLLVSIGSILSQSYKNFEYIIYDGRSSDGTKSAIKKYLNKNIKYICRSDKNYYEGLNYAIKTATGDFVGILNAGDKYFNSNILNSVYKKIVATRCDLLSGNLIYVNEKNYTTRVWNYKIKNLNLLTSLKIASPTLFVKRNIILSNFYDTNYSISSDVDFNLRISSKNLNFAYLNKFIIFMKTGGLSTNPKFLYIKIMQDILILRKYFKVLFIFIYLYKVLIKFGSFKIKRKLLN